METAKGVNHRRGHRYFGPGGAPPGQGFILSQVARLIVIVAGVLFLCYCARSVVLPVLLAWVGSMALSPPVAWLRARHVPAPLGAGLILALLGGLLVCGLIHFERPVADWINSAPETLPRLREKYQRLFAPISKITAALDGKEGQASDKAHSPAPAPALPSAGSSQIAGTLFTWTGSVLFGVVETVVLLFLLLISGDRFIYQIAHLLQALGDKGTREEISHQLQQNISTYLFSVSLINSVLGIAVGTALQCTGMPNAAMWGAVAAVINFVPYFGAIVGIVMVAGAGLLAFDTVARGLLPAAAYVVCHVLEADLITPLLLGRRFKMSAFVIFVVLMFFSWLWGVVGALLAMPLLVTLNVICSRVPALKPLADFLSA